MSLEEYKGVFVYAQQVDNEISSIALELLGKANELAKEYYGKVTNMQAPMFFEYRIAEWGLKE